MIDLKGRSLLTLKDYSADEIQALLDLSAELKAKKHAGGRGDALAGKNVALIFEKASTRTRCAFTVACFDEGAHAEYLGLSDIQLGAKESVKDTARVLGRMFDAIAFRGFAQQTVEELAANSGVPVYNALTDDDHPTQALADLLTLQEKLGRLRGVRLAYCGDGRNNMAAALLIASAKMGLDFLVVSPRALWPDAALLSQGEAWAKQSGGRVTVSDNMAACRGADAVYTDVWCSMGEEAKAAERTALLSPYRIDAAVMAAAGAQAVFMHCLPAVKGAEVTEDVFESRQSVVFDQAENRLHTIKAVLVATLA